MGKNLKRISRDKHYVDNLIFRLNYCSSNDRVGLELSQILSDSLNISPEIFMQTLQNFIDILPEKRGIEKSLWVKKFIKRVDYSRNEIAIILYYKGLESMDYGISASGLAEENAGRNSEMNNSKKDLGTLGFGSSNMDWLLQVAKFRTIF